MNKEISEEDARQTAKALKTLAEIEKSMQEEEKSKNKEKTAALQKDKTDASLSPAGLEKGDKETFSDIAKELESINYVVNANKENEKISIDNASLFRNSDKTDDSVLPDSSDASTAGNEKKYIDYRDKEEKKTSVKKGIFESGFKSKVIIFFAVLMGSLSFILKMIFYSTLLSMFLTPLLVVFFWSLFVYACLYVLEKQVPDLYQLILDFFTREDSNIDDAKGVGGPDMDDEDLDRDALFGGKPSSASSEEIKYSKTSNVEMQNTADYETSDFKGELLSDDPEGRFKDGKKVTTKDFDFAPNEIAKAVQTMMNKDKN